MVTQHKYDFKRNTNGKYAAVETLTDTMEALDVSSYGTKLNDEIANLNAKIEELKVGVKARQDMVLKIKSYARHIEQDLVAWKKRQQKEIKNASRTN